MALYTPVITKVDSIVVSGLYVQPTTLPFNMEFVVSGGNEPTNYEVEISSLTVSFTYTYSGYFNQSPQQVSFDATGKLPVRSDFLSCRVRTKSGSETSEWSVAKTFYTGREPYMRPAFESNTSADYLGPTQAVRLIYDPMDTQIGITGEVQILDSYILNLYDVKANKIVDTSGLQYTYIVDMEANQRVYFEYTFFGLEQGKTYLVEAIGNTSFNLSFTQRSLSNITIGYPIEDDSLLFADNNCKQGYIHIESPLKNINPSMSTYPDAGFTFDNGYYPGYNADTDKYGFTTWRGFNLNGNFTLQIEGRDFKELKENYDNVTLEGEYDAETGAYPKLTLKFRKDLKENLAWMECKLESYHRSASEVDKRHSYIAYSNAIQYPGSVEDVNVWIRYIDGLLDIELVRRGD